MFIQRLRNNRPIQSPKPIINEPEPVIEPPLVEPIIEPPLVDIPILTETRQPEDNDDNISLMSYNSFYETETINKPPKKLNLIFNNDNLEYILPNCEEDKPKRKYKPKLKQDK
jgi:hypothetical protein